MKLLFLCLSIIFLSAVTSSFYDIKFEALDGTIIKTSSYKGKKVVIALLSANASGLGMVTYLDSIQKANKSVQVIIIPTGDFDGSVSAQDLKSLKKNISLLVTKPLKVKKSNGNLQHPLFVWLTQVKENKHFDMDVQSEGQLFIVSERGTLYSVLPKDTPRNIISKVIDEPFTE